jgi:hypothetical protein
MMTKEGVLVFMATPYKEFRRNIFISIVTTASAEKVVQGSSKRG